MQRRRVGSSGLQVSRIGLGTMTWGDDTDGDAAAEQLRVFVQSGGTLVETADGYGGGIAQDVLAGLLRRAVSRDDLVIAGRSLLADGPHGGGAGRGALLGGLDRLLRRLGTDYLDLWQLPGWDPDVPLNETLAVADAAVTSGRVRYVGLVGPAGWQLATVAERARARWPSAAPTSVQAEYSLLARDAEAELLPAAAHHGAGLFAWAPLGRGVLTGTYADTPAVSPVRRGAPHGAGRPHRPGGADRGRRPRHVTAGRRPGLGARPARRRRGGGRGPRRGAAGGVDVGGGGDATGGDPGGAGRRQRRRRVTAAHRTFLASDAVTDIR